MYENPLVFQGWYITLSAGATYNYLLAANCNFLHSGCHLKYLAAINYDYLVANI